MVLADDNFATIIVAVEEGRKVFQISKNLSNTSCLPIWLKSLPSSLQPSLDGMFFNQYIFSGLTWLPILFQPSLLVWNQLSQVS